MRRIMNYELRIKGLGISIFCALFFILLALFYTTPAFAQIATSSAKNQTAQSQRIANMKDKANQEIDRRLNSLNKLINRIQAMKKITEADKTSLISLAQDQITNLTALKDKINTDSDLNTLKTDVGSITTQYRIYMLFIPRIHILAASDKLLEIADDINQIVPKLQSRIQAAEQAGKDVSAAQTTLADLQVKLADMQSQVKSAQELVTSLTPDQGNKTKTASNKTALQNALKKLQAARQDLRTAVQDIQTIKQNLNATSSATLEE